MVANAQTNSSYTSALFSEPKVELCRLTLQEPPVKPGAPERSPSDDPRSAVPDVEVAPIAETTNAPAWQATDSSPPDTEAELRRQLIRELDRAGHFEKPELPSENLFVRAADNIFRPEVIHIGKTTLSCSVVTAVKRKNPLCLLNPLFFQFTW